VDVCSWVQGEVGSGCVVFESEDFFRAVIEAREQRRPVFEFRGRDRDPGFDRESGYFLRSDYRVSSVDLLVSTSTQARKGMYCAAPKILTDMMADGYMNRLGY
jgi:hypothetical protein